MKKRADEQSENSQQNCREPVNKAKTKKAVYIYITTLFLVVILFMTLSYFIQQRNNTEISALNEKNVSSEQRIVNLQEMNLALKNENGDYQKKIEELEQQIGSLQSEIKELKSTPQIHENQQTTEQPLVTGKGQ